MTARAGCPNSRPPRHEPGRLATIGEHAWFPRCGVSLEQHSLLALRRAEEDRIATPALHEIALCLQSLGGCVLARAVLSWASICRKRANQRDQEPACLHLRHRSRPYEPTDEPTSYDAVGPRIHAPSADLRGWAHAAARRCNAHERGQILEILGIGQQARELDPRAIHVSLLANSSPFGSEDEQRNSESGDSECNSLQSLARRLLWRVF